MHEAQDLTLKENVIKALDLIGKGGTNALALAACAVCVCLPRAVRWVPLWCDGCHCDSHLIRLSSVPCCSAVHASRLPDDSRFVLKARDALIGALSLPLSVSLPLSRSLCVLYSIFGRRSFEVSRCEAETYQERRETRYSALRPSSAIVSSHFLPEMADAHAYWMYAN